MKDDTRTKPNNPHQGVQCTNIFKNNNTISNSLTNIWVDIINTIEDTGGLAHNCAVQSHIHHNLEKDEVRN